MQVNCLLWALKLKMRTPCQRICQMLAQWIVQLRQWVIFVCSFVSQFVIKSYPAMVFLIGWSITRLQVVWLMCTALAPQLGSNTQNLFPLQSSKALVGRLQQLTPWSYCTLCWLEDKVVAHKTTYISFGGGRSKCSKCKSPEPQLEFCCALAEKMLTNNLGDDGMTEVQVGQPVTWGSL